MLHKRSFSKPDETRRPSERTKVDVVKMGNFTVARQTFEPGWKWSEDVKPKVVTENCEVHHLIYIVSGEMKVVMLDGTEATFSTGQVGNIPPGHDAWVVGDEPVVLIDFSGGATYAKE
mgnify:CR=1 FL=1